MAETRHAAGTVYEVHEALEGEPPVNLGLRFETTDFGAALDYAFDYLEKRDPGRDGAVQALEIVRVTGTERERVWSYSHTRAAEIIRDPVGVWGFDVTRRWSVPARTPTRPIPVRRYT